MANWKLTLSYDGSPFHGWQVQPGHATVQGTLARAIEHIVGEHVLPQGSGRTDAGVHALAQVASFPLESPIPSANLQRALNRTLPPSIRVLRAEIAPPGFHARHSATRKTYEYRIFDRLADTTAERICPPFLAPFVWDCRWPLDLESMQRAAALLLGTHDFTSFAASDPDLTVRLIDNPSSRPQLPSPSITQELSSRPQLDSSTVMRSGETCSSADAATTFAPNPTKTLFASNCVREHDLLLYRVTGSGFLHHMVRNIVGTLVEVGRGSLAVEEIVTILKKKDRSAAGPTAAACGLFLVSVEYAEPKDDVQQPSSPESHA